MPEMNGPSEQIEVLLVDDRPENLLALETVLASENYRLVRAQSGDEALRYLLDHEPALILLDVQMPDLDGFETASIIKGSERTRSIPIIFVTALNQDERYQLKAYQHGAIDYLYKPYDPRILKSKVAVFAELSQKTKSLLRAEKRLQENERKNRERQIAQLELKNLRREQLEQKKYLDLVAGISHGIVWSLDADTWFVNFVSPSTETILGYSVDQWMAESDFFLNHVAPLDRELIKAGIESAKQGSKGLQIEHRFIASDGREIWCQTELKMEPKSQSGGHEIRGLSIDISKLKSSQVQLAKSKQRSDFIAEASLILGQSFAPLQKLKEVGERLVLHFADYFSVLQVDAGGEIKKLMEVQSSLKPWDLSADDLWTAGANLSHESGNPECLRELPEDHLLITYRVKSAIFVPIRTDGGDEYMMVWLSMLEPRYDFSDLAMATDIGLRTRIALENAALNQKAEAAVKMRDEFLSVASHELKTPLTPLKLQSQMLTRILRSSVSGEVKIDKVDKILSTFDRQIDRLSLLIDELLDISRMSNGKLSLNFESFDLLELIHEILNRFGGQLSGANCEVSIDADDSLLVEWDRFRIEQVIVNLITNACKYGAGETNSLKCKS